MEWPVWPCPECYEGRLVLQAQSLKQIEHGHSANAHGHEAWEPEWISKQFSALLKCNLPECGEAVSVAGSVTVKESQSNYEDRDTMMYLNLAFSRKGHHFFESQTNVQQL
jgi:hypothetical protein